MLLTIDVGNTNTVLGVFDGTKLLDHWRLATEARRTADEYGLWIRQVLQWAGISAERISRASDPTSESNCGVRTR